MKAGYFIAAILLSFLVIACTGQQQNVGTTFIGGTTGLTLEFLPDSPPDQIYDAGKFPFAVVVQIKNLGEWDVEGTQAILSLSGVDPSDYSKTSADLTKPSPQKLDATTKDSQGNILSGTTANIDFSGLNYKNTIPGDIQQTMLADLCYNYGTKVASSLCVKKDLTSTDATICAITGERSVSNSGAPVQITSIRESPAGTDKLQFSMVIKYQGTGKLWEKDYICSQSDKLLQQTKKNRVHVKIDSGLPTPPQCSGLQDQAGNMVNGAEGYVTLYNGEWTLTCTQELATDRNDFEKPMSIGIEYRNEDSITKPITVKHI